MFTAVEAAENSVFKVSVDLDLPGLRRKMFFHDGDVGDGRLASIVDGPAPSVAVGLYGVPLLILEL